MTQQEQGSLDNHRVRIVRSDQKDIAFILTVYTDGRVSCQGQLASNRPWVADTLGRIIAAVKAGRL